MCFDLSKCSFHLFAGKVLVLVGTCRPAKVGGESSIEHQPPVEDDPQRRRPDIALAKVRHPAHSSSSSLLVLI